MKLSFRKSPVQGVRVVLTSGGTMRSGPDDGRVVATAKADSRGIAHFFAVPAGAYMASVQDGLLFSEPEVKVLDSEKSGQEFALDWPVEAIPVRALRGRLTMSEELSEEPTPLQEASVELLDLRTSRLIEASQTNENGSYEFSTVTPGLYVLRVNRPAKGKIESGKRDLAVELDPAAREVAIPEMKVLQSECAGVQLFQKIGNDWEQQ